MGIIRIAPTITKAKLHQQDESLVAQLRPIGMKWQ